MTEPIECDSHSGRETDAEARGHGAWPGARSTPKAPAGPHHRPIEPQGNGLHDAIGELLTCTRGADTWSAFGLVGLRTVSPFADGDAE